MIVITGAAGFIGSNLLKAFNNVGENNILIVDDLKDGHKFQNIVDCDFVDYLDMSDFLARILDNDLPDDIEIIYHQGACSSTTEWDGQYLMDVNYNYSKALLHYCLEHDTSLIYASSAAVYGSSEDFTPNLAKERPLNLYGYTKLLFDRYVNKVVTDSNAQIVGLRYFNVYGPREDHKKNMTSVVRHFYNQLKDTGEIDIFQVPGCAPGEQKRDLIHVDDVVAVNMWLYDHGEVNGIYNCGTGKAVSFNEIAQAVIQCCGIGKINYTPLPEKLQGCYQTFTEADMSGLRQAGYQAEFIDINTGVKKYLATLNE